MSERFIIKDRYKDKYEWKKYERNGQVHIIVDQETGVNYLFVNFDNAGGLTPLLDADGKPVITKE